MIINKNIDACMTIKVFELSGNNLMTFSQTSFCNKPHWGPRNWIQILILILTIAIGIQFYIYVMQISGDGAVTVKRPPGVEGFLPIGALMGWKLFLTTGIWDPIHPAAMVILGFAGLISFLFRKSFCSWFCPIGTLSEWAWKIGDKITGRNFRPPLWIDYPLRGIKYLLLGFFILAISSMSKESIYAFLESPYYKLSDVKMLHFFTGISTLTAIVVSFLIIASFFIRNFWCRYICPYGALMGLLSSIGPTRVERDLDTCINCSKCTKVCPHYLPVENKLRIYSPECSGCMDCTLVCPVEETLQMKTIGTGKRVWSALSLGIVICLLFAGIVYSAKITGHWQTGVQEEEIRTLINKIDSPLFTHPDLKFGK